MAVQKMTWLKMIENHRTTINSVIADINKVNTDYRKVMGIIFNGNAETPDIDHLKNMVDMYLSEDSLTNVWSDLNIFLSTLKIKNVRIYYELFDELKKKMAYVISLTKGYSSKRSTTETHTKDNSEVGTLTDKIKSNSNSSVDTSDTPQVGNVAFDPDTIDYRSGMTRGKENDDSNRDSSNTVEKKESGSHNIEISDVKFKELKDLDLEKIKNDITDYIFSIPQKIYDFYSLDVTPQEEINKLLYGE